MKRTSHGFTLVELLVVITIIGILMGLLIPAVNAARETARRNQCAVNMKNLGLAAMQHENTKGELPGYVDKFGNFIGDGMGGLGDDPSEPGQVADVPPHVKIGTWAVALLPWLDAQPTYEHWTQDRYPVIGVTRTGGEYDPTSDDRFDGLGFHELAAPNLAIFQCPSNPITDAQHGRNSYVSNNGDAYFVTVAAQNGDSPTPPAPGVAGPMVNPAAWVKSMNRNQGAFSNKYQGFNSTPPLLGDKVRLDDFKDGQGYTLLFSENVQALPWHRAGYLNAFTGGSGPDMTTGIDYSAAPPVTDIVFNPDVSVGDLAAARYTNGMVWHYEDANNSAMPNHPVTNIPCLPVYVKHRINGRGQAVGQDIFTLTMQENTGNYIDLARPSSAHVSGVNVATADGGTRYINDNIDYRVLQALMTPRGKSSSVPFPEYILSDESL